MRTLLTVVIPLLLFSCSLLSDSREVRLLPPEEYPHLGGPPEEFLLVMIDLYRGEERRWSVPSGRDIRVMADKESLSCVLLYPRGYPEPFSPLPAALFLDPSSGNTFRFSWSSGPAGILARRLCTMPSFRGFNFPRLALQSESRLGLQAWQTDLKKWEQRILEGRFSSIYIKPQTAEEYRLNFPAGCWISEDPGQSGFYLDNRSDISLYLVPEQKLRFLEQGGGGILELQCQSDGKLLVLDR